MLPYSTYEFFIIIAIFIAVLWICKYLFKEAAYKYVLAVLNFVFLILIYPKPYHFLILIAFSYSATFIISGKFINKVWGILLLLLPLLLVKLDIRISSYPFEFNSILSFAGLSYASFRIIGYYMDKAPDERMADFASYFNYLSFTPTLLIGPIDKFSRFKASQEIGFLSINLKNSIVGWNAIVKGLAFKYVIAELISRYWLGTFDSSNTKVWFIINNMYAYYFYLFFDFAGYSFMALGVGKMMGINVPINFTNPFLAENPQDFWRRFHISLGDWLKDYFFTPLYMFLTRKKSLKKYPLARQNVSLVLTFFLMGCWNGFKLHFILSGLMFGAFSAIHNSYVVYCKKSGRDIIFGSLNTKIVRIISVLIMFNLVALALYIFSGRCPFIS